MLKIKHILTILFLLVSVPLFCLQHIPESICGFMDSDGDPVEEGYVAFYSTAALSSFKDVYSDYSGLSVVSQSGDGIQLNASGQPTSGGNAIALFGNGTYWVRVKDEDGVIIATYESLIYSEPASPDNTPWVNIAEVYGTEDSDIQSAISAYSDGTRVKFLFNGDFTISSSQEFKASMALWFVDGSTLTIDVGNTLTINSDDVIFENASYIDNSGTVVLGTPNITASNENNIFQGTGDYSGALANRIVYDNWYGGGNNISVSREGFLTVTGNVLQEKELRLSRYAGNSLDLAIAEATANSTIIYNLLIDRDFTLTKSQSIPSNVRRVTGVPDSEITFGAYDLTFNGQYLDAQSTGNIFNQDSTGETIGPISNRYLYPEWWGAKAGDVTFDNHDAFIDAANFCASFTVYGSAEAAGIVKLGSRRYWIQEGITLNSTIRNVIFEGCGRASTVIEATGNVYAIFYFESNNRNTVRELALRGVGKGVVIDKANLINVQDCTISTDGSAVLITGAGGATDYTRIERCYMRFSGEDDEEPSLEIRRTQSNNILIRDCNFGEGGTYGILADGGTYLNIEDCGFDGYVPGSATGNTAIRIEEFNVVNINNCRFESFVTAILLQPGGNTEGRNISIEGCEFKGSTSVAEYGIRSYPVGIVHGLWINNNSFRGIGVTPSAFCIDIQNKTYFTTITQSNTFRGCRNFLSGTDGEVAIGSTAIDLSMDNPDLSDVVANPDDYGAMYLYNTNQGFYNVSSADDTTKIVTTNLTATAAETDVNWELYDWTAFVNLQGAYNYWYSHYPEVSQGIKMRASGNQSRLRLYDRLTVENDFDTSNGTVIFLGEDLTATPNAPTTGIRWWYDKSKGELSVINASGNSTVIHGF